ncbi:hypothetical protein [Planctomyces sp. SH-PL14]|uniref:hypothetical protein n=1 Tax=Planctomyces sp. SH-PL14 TaxID=1632864 RepID=UPI00078BF105|nr:hypothetical protein [Planctomyces sp. SH-PL14]AMV20444.1 hypothetical protein VT03_21275 [Planctomyces sp. SH-PL14]
MSTGTERPIYAKDLRPTAILSGQQTQFRVPVKVPKWASGREIEIDEHGLVCAFNSSCETHSWITCPFARIRVANDRVIGPVTMCYRPDGHFWMKEPCWQHGHNYRHDFGESGEWEICWSGDRQVRFDEPPKAEGPGWDRVQWKKIPSIHMPRWASRLTLEITGIKVERLQDISEEDAIAEGIEPVRQIWKLYGKREQWEAEATGQPIKSFLSLWESINGDGSWALNPWIWAIDFKRIEVGQ